MADTAQNQTTLTTERLVLRPWRMDDAEALFRYASDRDVGPAAGWPPHTSVDESRRVIRDVLQAPETYAITIRDHSPADEPVGAITLRLDADNRRSARSRDAEIGYWIGKPFWGNGYIPEAIREIVRHAFEDLGLDAIWAAAFADNARGLRVQQKAGFTPHHFQRDVLRRQLGEAGDERISRLTRTEWELSQRLDPVDEVTLAQQQDEAAQIIAELPLVSLVRSGGQTGADRGGLDAARDAGVPICGWCPAGGLAEDMPEPPGVRALYPELVEGPSSGYVERTAWNVRDAHATLIVAPAGLEPKSGTEMTARFALDFGRPVLVVKSMDDLPQIRTWLAGVGQRGITLNVAGPRESKLPGVYALTRAIVRELL